MTVNWVAQRRLWAVHRAKSGSDGEKHIGKGYVMARMCINTTDRPR